MPGNCGCGALVAQFGFPASKCTDCKCCPVNSCTFEFLCHVKSKTSRAVLATFFAALAAGTSLPQVLTASGILSPTLTLQINNTSATGFQNISNLTASLFTVTQAISFQPSSKTAVINEANFITPGLVTYLPNPTAPSANVPMDITVTLVFNACTGTKIIEKITVIGSFVPIFAPNTPPY